MEWFGKNKAYLGMILMAGIGILWSNGVIDDRLASTAEIIIGMLTGVAVQRGVHAARTAAETAVPPDQATAMIQTGAWRALSLLLKHQDIERANGGKPVARIAEYTEPKKP